MLGTSWILHSGGADFESFTYSMTSVFWRWRWRRRIPASKTAPGSVTHNVTIIHVPRVRQATIFLQRVAGRQLR